MTVLPARRERHYHVNDPFMNYQMPVHVHADPRVRRLLGFLPHGAYEKAR